jgi:transcription-repair coupling factor (superfamily II helicase)
MFLSPFVSRVELAAAPGIPHLAQTGARALYLARQIQTHPHTPTLMIVRDRKEAEAYQEYLRTLGIDDCPFYPTPSLSPYAWSGEERHSCVQRHQIRLQLQHSEQPPRCIFATYKSLSHLLMDNLTWYQATLNLYQGERIAPPLIVQRLIQAGYQPCGGMPEPGEFTRRGAVIDVYPVGSTKLLRMEWFDDEIESLRWLQPTDTLKAFENTTAATIAPAYEWLIPAQQEELIAQLLSLGLNPAIEPLRSFQYRPEQAAFLSLMGPTTSLAGLMPAGTHIFWDEGLKAKALAYHAQLDEEFQQSGGPRRHLPQTLLESELAALKHQEFLPHDGRVQGALLPPVERNFDAMARSFQRWLAEGWQLSVVTQQPQRILSILQERNCPAQLQEVLAPGQKAVGVIRGHLPEGFAYAPMNWFCFSDHELFEGQVRVIRKQAVTGRQKSPITRLSQLKEGMLIVHEVHGVGRYQGLVQFNTTGQVREYLSVHYAGTDRLLVPIEQMHRLHLYHGVGESQVKLNKLGGSDWERAKQKVKQALIEVAEELLRTEARRQQSEGFAVPPDTAWQQEMESAFPYQETPDQLKAIQETKLDMEAPLPMNRLICGDVGFGKTEVALRAAFKAAAAGRQVAFLCPTTILAHQHYQLLKERFAPYPVRVELLSRYKTGKESDQIFAEIKSGAVDVVVATHRLLSKKLSFHNLGLMIIDEEHRFGVLQKEKLKALQPNIDILTMSATPIPRTLHTALGGLKALSLIETPPTNRLPIKTLVEPYSEEVLKKAILEEMQRGGQVYYVHNRVKDIESIASKIQEIVPQARIRIAHGQMSKQELETTMWDFYNYEFDVLICTTIIESGLDISNVNTLIVERVELLGLAQIHQLRGRVGRSSAQGYAYLLYDPLKPLTREAHERLLVVKEFTQLGSGYYIALKDMEIRGIGNLVGPQQHGNIVTVGFETYCQLLEETVAQLRGEADPGRRHRTCTLDLNIPAFIPEDWIPDLAEKMTYYRSLAYADTTKVVDRLRQQAVAQYGPMPMAADALWRISRVRIRATHLGLFKAGYTEDWLDFEGTIDESLFVKAQRLQKALRHWSWSPERLRHPKAGLRDKNLSRLETLVDTLWKVSALEESEDVE